MSTTATLKPGNQLWGIFFTDREYAREIGDPLRTVVEAPTKIAAEEAAMRLGFGDTAAATNANEPQETQSTGLSMSEVSTRTGIRSELKLTTICPRLRIAVAFALPMSFPVHIRTISPYVLI